MNVILPASDEEVNTFILTGEYHVSRCHFNSLEIDGVLQNKKLVGGEKLYYNLLPNKPA